MSARRAYGADTPENRTLREQFAFNHPEIVSGAVYEQGREARRDGKPLGACPYIPSAPEYVEWRNGWNEARRAVDAPLAVAAE